MQNAPRGLGAPPFGTFLPGIAHTNTTKAKVASPLTHKRVRNIRDA